VTVGNTPGGMPASVVVAGVFDVAFDGLAVLDERGRYLYVNPAGCVILGSCAEELVGLASFVPPDATDQVRATSTTVTWPRSGSPRDRELTYRWLELAAGRPGGVVVAFRDITEQRLRERQLAAFARAAESVAYAGSLRGTLDMICDEIVQSTGLAAGQILLIDGTDLGLQVHGAAPAAAFPPDFELRLDEARRRGAQLKSLIALSTGRPVVAPHRKPEMLASREWEPLHEHFDAFEWDSFVSAPLRSHGVPSARSTSTTGPVTIPRRPMSPSSARWPTRPPSPCRTRASSPPRGVARRSRSATGWPGTCTTPPARSSSR
jgi:PAS domain S-box-containing protein